MLNFVRYFSGSVRLPLHIAHGFNTCLAGDSRAMASIGQPYNQADFGSCARPITFSWQIFLRAHRAEDRLIVTGPR